MHHASREECQSILQYIHILVSKEKMSCWGQTTATEILSNQTAKGMFSWLPLKVLFGVTIALFLLLRPIGLYHCTMSDFKVVYCL